MINEKSDQFYRVRLTLDNTEGIYPDIRVLRRVGDKPAYLPIVLRTSDRQILSSDRQYPVVSPPNRADRRQRAAVRRVADRSEAEEYRKRKRLSRHREQLRSLSNAVRHRSVEFSDLQETSGGGHLADNLLPEIGFSILYMSLAQRVKRTRIGFIPEESLPS